MSDSWSISKKLAFSRLYLYSPVVSAVITVLQNLENPSRFCLSIEYCQRVISTRLMTKWVLPVLFSIPLQNNIVYTTHHHHWFINYHKLLKNTTWHKSFTWKKKNCRKDMTVSIESLIYISNYISLKEDWFKYLRYIAQISHYIWKIHV